MSALTKGELIRWAFNMLGVSYNVTDVDTDDSLNGRYARDAWEQGTKYIFSKFMWNFAQTRQQLSQVVTPPPPQGWGSLYQIPPDAVAIHLVTIWPRGPYQIWGQYIAANINPLWLDYQLMPAVSAWPYIFSMYVSAMVAVLMGPNVTQNQDMMSNAQKTLSKWEADAQVYVSQSQTAMPLFTAPFISCRQGYYGNGVPGFIFGG